jgi:hypothetical protein
VEDPGIRSLTMEKCSITVHGQNAKCGGGIYTEFMCGWVVSKIVFYLLRFGFAYFLFILHSGLIPFPWFETRRVPPNKIPATNKKKIF